MCVYTPGGIGAGGEGDDGGWDGWMASLTWWTWVWVNSGSWWWTRRPGLLRFMGSQRVGHDWATELNWYVTRQLDKWVIWNHENSSFNWTLKGKKKQNKNITESHIMLQKIQVLQLYAFIQSRFHSDASWEKESKNADWGLVHNGLLNWLVGFANWSHQLNQLTEWTLRCVHSVKLIPSSNPNVFLFAFWKSEWRGWVTGMISWPWRLFGCTYRILRVTRPVEDAPEHSICLEGFCCHLPPVLWSPSSHSCCRKKKWLLGYVRLWPHGSQPARLLCPWDSPVKTTGVACHDLFQGIFLTQGLNPGLLHCREILYHLCHQGSTKRHLYTGLPFPSGEGNGTPLQYSCLENPMDGGAW